MHFHYHLDDISLSALRKDLKGYNKDTFCHDLYAGLSVALLTIPQAIAYSMLAGLPLFCGLFAAIYSSIAAAAFVSSRHLVVGPSNAIAILVQAGTSEILFTYYRDFSGPEREMIALQVLTQLSLLVGLIQIVFAGCKLGRLTQFVSHSVVVGYISGTALAVVLNQLYTLIGLSRLPGVYSLYERAVYFATHFYRMHWVTACVGIGSLALLIVIKRYDKRLPAAVFTFVFMAFVVYLFDLSSFADSVGVDPYFDERVQKVMLVGDTGEPFDVIPRVEFPFFNTGIMNNLLPMAFAIALLSMLESTSVAKSIAASSGQRLSVNQEVFGIGIGNLVSAFTGGMPVSGNVSRSGMNYANGGKTRFAAIFSAMTVGIFLYCFSFLFNLIPEACLGALLLYNSASIVNPRQFFLCLKATSSDAFVLWLTLISCIFFSLDIAFYIGTILSITLYLKKAAIPQLVEYDVDVEAGELKPVDYSKKHVHKPIRVIKVEGELFLGPQICFRQPLKRLLKMIQALV